MSLLLAFLAFAQVGPFVKPGPQPVSPLPPEVIERKAQEQRKPRAAPAEAQQLPAPQSELDRCLAAVEADPLAALDYAQAWLQQAKGVPASQAGHCLGVALGRLERWDEAEAAFRNAREMAADNLARARLGAMAGNAALARGGAADALAALDGAHADALAAADKPLAGDIAIDRARALVALKRDADAAAALAEARATLPGNPQAWLLSATLSRRMGKLAEAQAQIEKAAELMPIDSDIGLEAGVIAVLSGRDEAARKSWQSVVDAAPKSDAATTARGYLAQLGPGTSPQKVIGR
jgi:tetratricopeptide (TPR) repeat protein